jgi:hypothetical protein
MRFVYVFKWLYKSIINKENNKVGCGILRHKIRTKAGKENK